MPTSSTHLSPLDLTLVAAYLIAITLFGLRFSRRDNAAGNNKTLKSYFLANNTIPWWAIALSIVSAETSTLTIVSIPGVAFAGNLGFLQVVLGYMLGRIVVAALFLPKYFRGEMLTAYQLIDRRFGHTLHKVTAGLFLLTRAAAEGVRVFAISIVISVAIGTGDTLSIAIISALTLLYTFEGGMAAVIWTDVVQMALYVAGTLLALYTLAHHVPGGWSHIHAVAAPLGKFHWLDFSLTLTKSYTFWAGILGGTFLTMASHGTDQLMVQRMLAARNLRESRLALLSSGAVIFLQFTLFLLIGVGLFVFYSTHPTTFRTNDYIFPTFIVQQMPHGVAGLLIAAILAAAMSNLSAALNSLASTTVIDFYVPFKQRAFKARIQPEPVILSEAPRGLSRGAQSKDPEGTSPATNVRPFQPQLSTPDQQAISPRQQSLISRLSTIFWAIILFAIAIYCVHTGGKGHVVETGLSIASVAYGCLLGVFLLGTLTKYATQTGAILGMIAGLATNLSLWQASLPKPFLPMPTLPHIAFTWYVLIGSAITFAVGTLFSLTLPRERAMTAAILLTLAIGCPMITQAQASVIVGSVPTPPQTPTYDFTPIDTLITQAIAAHKLPGAVVLIGHNGTIAYEHAYGNRTLEPGDSQIAEPMTEDTLFDMASLTKVLVTTTAILQLYEQNKLDLDTPAAHYLPAFADPTLLSSRSAADGAASGPATTPQALTWKSRITIRQLLTHYSGLPEDITLTDPWGLAAPDKPEAIGRALTAIPYGPPGQTFKYSDINFITLGYLVEQLSGEPLDLYARNHIFNPLGMTHTAYHPFDKTCGPATRLGSAVYPGPRPIGRILQTAPTIRLGGTFQNPDPNQPAPSPRESFACPAGTWSPNALFDDTAPTAHDDQGTPITNPDFDHLLRGTVHDPTTRRMGGVAGHAGVFSTAQDSAKFCQALLDKLLRNTGPFPLRQSTLQLVTSPQAPATAVTTATIFTPEGQTTTGVAQRGLGWDLNSPFSRPRGTVFPIATRKTQGSFGHTGFTGTSLWLDPTSNTYVILLANSIHIKGAASISPLRGQLATAAAKALHLDTIAELKSGYPAFLGQGGVFPSVHPVILSEGRSPQSKDPDEASPTQTVSPFQPQTSTLYTPPFEPKNPCAPPIICDSFGAPPGIHPASFSPLPPPQTLTGIDVLEATNFAPLTPYHHIALLTNNASRDAHGTRTIDILAQAPNLHLTTLFTPEHGLAAHQDAEHLTAETDPATHLPVISLYGAHPADRHPKQSDLKQLDAIVIDLQDAGVRFWTYETVLGYMLEACSKAHIPVFVLDRPNPISGTTPQGPTSDLGLESYTNFTPLPVRHGLTFGELARYFNATATEVQLKPEILNANPLDIGPPVVEITPPATHPGLHANLTVIPMQHWRRTNYYAATGLPWIPPSPNLRTLAATILYPAVGLTEQTNISVGRGTPTPFENLGAPWIDAPTLATYLTNRQIPGILITPTTLTIAETPEHYPSHGQTIPGLHFEVTNPTLFDSPEFGIELLAALDTLYPKQFHLDQAHTLLANAQTLTALHHHTDPRDIAATWLPALNQFREATKPYLLY